MEMLRKSKLTIYIWAYIRTTCTTLDKSPWALMCEHTVHCREQKFCTCSILFIFCWKKHTYTCIAKKYIFLITNISCKESFGTWCCQFDDKFCICMFSCLAAGLGDLPATWGEWPPGCGDLLAARWGEAWACWPHAVAAPIPPPPPPPKLYMWGGRMRKWFIDLVKAWTWYTERIRQVPSKCTLYDVVYRGIIVSTITSICFTICKQAS